MSEFNERLKELMKENNIDAKILARSLGLSYTSIIYKWLRGEKKTSLNIAVRLADYFQCTLDFLAGKGNDDKTVICLKIYKPFDEQLKKVLFEKNIRQYKLLEDKVVSRGNLNNWFNNKCTPNLESVIKLADYLNVTIDYLVGRE